MNLNLYVTGAASGTCARRNELLSLCLIAGGLMLPASSSLAQNPGAGPASQAKTFIEYFLPTPIVGELSRDAWGATNVLPRDPRNGLEDTTIKNTAIGTARSSKPPTASTTCSPVGGTNLGVTMAGSARKPSTRSATL